MLRVDITAGGIHSWDPATGDVVSRQLDPPVGFAVPRRDGGLVVGQGRTLAVIDRAGEPHVLAEVEPGLEHNRFNDAKSDAEGRLWAGTLSTVREPGVAGLYRLDPDGLVTRHVENTTISNGIGWSPDRTRMYFIDSTTQRVDEFDFDPGAGELSNRRTLVEVDPKDGLPDGLAVDAEGRVWVALFGGAAVHRYSPEGRLEAVVRLPTSNVTCPAFGGAELDVLYMTTARHRLSETQLRAQPLAGAVFAVRPGVRGLPAHEFAG